MNALPNLTVTICATREHAQALLAQAHRVQANAIFWPGPVRVILVGDDSPELRAAEEEYRELMPAAVVDRYPILGESYERPENHDDAMMILARMRTYAFSRARVGDPDYVWSLDSDVLPPANALRCMRDMLAFDDGYYDVATCPYPNQGFIGGRGSRANPIFPGTYPEERKLPARLSKRLADLKRKKPEGWEAEVAKINAEIQAGMDSYPAEGNVFMRNGKAWRRRGWLDDAYPALGKGAVVPIDWAGFGCNLISREALAFINWDGYAGAGTEDLFVCYERWQQAGMRICAIPHVLCDHVKVNPGRREEKIIHLTRHETEGEMVGHTRVENRPYYQHQTADRRNPKFKGRFLPAIKPMPHGADKTDETNGATKKTLLDRAFAVGMLQVRSEVAELYDWLLARKLSDVLEIGTDGGGLLYLLLHMTAGRAVSVDKERGQYGTGIDFAWRNAAFDEAFPGRMQWINGDSAEEEVRRQVEGEFDLIVIDGDHRQAFADFSHYRAYLRPGGWMLFHDIKDTPQHRAQGVTVAGDWKKAKEFGKECVELCDESAGWGGIGLLRL